MHKEVMKTVPKKEKEEDDSLHLAFDDKPTIVGTIVNGNIRQSVELLVFSRHFSKIFPNPQDQVSSDSWGTAPSCSESNQ